MINIYEVKSIIEKNYFPLKAGYFNTLLSLNQDQLDLVNFIVLKSNEEIGDLKEEIEDSEDENNDLRKECKAFIKEISDLKNLIEEYRMLMFWIRALNKIWKLEGTAIAWQDERFNEIPASSKKKLIYILDRIIKSMEAL